MPNRPIPPLDELSQDSARFVEDVQKETDRGVALVAVAFLEDCLGALLRSRCVDDARAVAGFLKRHWSIDSRANLAYCFGLITKEYRRDLAVITEIRNNFGHGHRPASFNDQRVFDACERLREYKADVTVTVGDVNPPRVEGRFKFISSVVYLTMMILMRAHAFEADRNAAAAAPPTPPPPTSRHG